MTLPHPHDPPFWFPYFLELRKRFIRSLFLLFFIFIVLFPWAPELYHLMAAPVLSVLGQQGMVATQLSSTVTVPLRLVWIASLFLALPWMAYEFWSFVAPALYPREQRFWIPMFVFSLVLFYLGVLFCYILVLPLLFRFFVAATPEGISLLPDIHQHLETCLSLFWAFGLCFQTPVLLMLAIRGGVLSSEDLRHFRRYFIVLAFIVGMLLTPPDVLSQVLLALPLCALYEGSLWLCTLYEKKRRMLHA